MCTSRSILEMTITALKENPLIVFGNSANLLGLVPTQEEENQVDNRVKLVDKINEVLL